MGANTGIGLPGDGGGGTDLSGLSDNQVPRFNAATNRLENSGFQIHPMTRALQGATNIETLADVQSGVSTFRLGQAHTMTSAGGKRHVSAIVLRPIPYFTQRGRRQSRQATGPA